MQGAKGYSNYSEEEDEDEPIYPAQPYAQHFPYPIYPQPQVMPIPSPRRYQDPLVGKYVYVPPVQVTKKTLNRTVEGFLQRQIQEFIRNIAEEMLKFPSGKKIAYDLLDNLINEVVFMESVHLVRQSVNQLAENHLHLAHAHEHLVDIMNDVLRNDLLPEILLEAWIEEMSTIFLPKILDDGMDIRSIVESAILDCGEEKRKKHVNSLRNDASGELLDSMILSYLLSLGARQGQLVTKNEYSTYFIDGVLVDILIEQHFQVLNRRNTLQQHKSLKRFHERAFTDRLTNVLLHSLQLSLEEDAEDLHQHEQGIELVKNWRYGAIEQPI